MVTLSASLNSTVVIIAVTICYSLILTSAVLEQSSTGLAVNSSKSNQSEFWSYSVSNYDGTAKQTVKSLPKTTTGLKKSQESAVSKPPLAILAGPIVNGLRVEESTKPPNYDSNKVQSILSGSSATIRIFGQGLYSGMTFRFVTGGAERGSSCDHMTSSKFIEINQVTEDKHSATVQIQLPPLDEGEEYYHLCVNVSEEAESTTWVHQGTDPWVKLTSHENVLPLWAHVILLVVLLLLSGLFSGLNLGLMAIDKTELKILMNTGTVSERSHAKKVQPLRDNGNYLLCSLLLGNVLVNASLTILLDSLTSGLVAVIGSTLGIVIFGEIIPQAFCSRHGLAVGARTIYLTKAVMLITFPVAYPISFILDKCLGEEIGNIYNRERLKELLKHGQNDLEKAEVNMISGALEFNQKTVQSVMTELDDVYMLPLDAVLDFTTVSQIMSQGYSRIPVYESSRKNIVSLLYTKDLAFVDPDDKMPLRTICEFYKNPINYVFENTTLNVIFEQFKEGNKGHLAFVRKVVTTQNTDPFYETIGVVTLEDVIEELIQVEINDETDVMDGLAQTRTDVSPDSELGKLMKPSGIQLSPQLALATLQFLSTTVEPFNSHKISQSILKRLLNQNVVFEIKIGNREDQNNKEVKTILLYERGEPVDYFILILEGRVQAEMGRESLLFESGPFTYFGTQSLTLTSMTSINSRPHVFIPDYTVRAITDVTYVRIPQFIYAAARQATLLAKTHLTQPELDAEVDRVMTQNETKLTHSKRGSETILSEIILRAQDLERVKAQDNVKRSNSLGAGENGPL